MMTLVMQIDAVDAPGLRLCVRHAIYLHLQTSLLDRVPCLAQFEELKTKLLFRNARGVATSSEKTKLILVRSRVADGRQIRESHGFKTLVRDQTFHVGQRLIALNC